MVHVVSEASRYRRRTTDAGDVKKAADRWWAVDVNVDVDADPTEERARQGGMQVEARNSYLVLAIRPQRERTIKTLAFRLFVSWSPFGRNRVVVPPSQAHLHWRMVHGKDPISAMQFLLEP